MSNKYGIPAEVEQKIRSRDKMCVYCLKVMIYPYIHSNPDDSATIEHFREEGPFYWKGHPKADPKNDLKEEDLAICCGSCNRDRLRQKLLNWFQTAYCTDRERPINRNTVKDPVKEYIERNEG